MRKYNNLKFDLHWKIDPTDCLLLGECQAISETLAEFPIQNTDYSDLLRVFLRKGAVATIAIEGNTLTEDEASEIDKGKDLPASQEYQQRDYQNVLDTMNWLVGEKVVDPLTPELIKDFHYRLGQGIEHNFNATPGHFAQNSRVVGHYKAPDHRDVPALVKQLCDWTSGSSFPRLFPGDSHDTASAIVKAVVTHVYFEWIHPFDDGNGRTGRMLEFYVLLQAGLPDVSLHVLSNHYNLTRDRYYKELETAGSTADLSQFLSYAIAGYRDGLKDVMARVVESQISVSWRDKIYATFGSVKMGQKRDVFRRRRRLALDFPMDRVISPSEVPNITTVLAGHYAGKQLRTIKRDLAYLVELELLIINEDGSYSANVALVRSMLPAALKQKKIRALKGLSN